MLECVIPEAKYCKVYSSMDSCFLSNKLENTFLSLLKDKKNVKFWGYLIGVNHISIYNMFLVCLCNLNARFTPLILKYYTNPLFV